MSATGAYAALYLAAYAYVLIGAALVWWLYDDSDPLTARARVIITFTWPALLYLYVRTRWRVRR